jgi:small-conductance mechanosensitive channel
MLDDFLQQIYFGNRIIDYIVALGIFLLLLLVINISKKFLIKILHSFARKSTTKIDDKFVEAFQNKIKPFVNLLYFGAFYLGFSQLKIPSPLEKMVNIAIIALLIFFGVRFFLSIFSYFLENYWIKKESNATRITAIRGVETFFRIVLWMIAFIILLDNLGIKVSALVAGLGIGGIAVALAAQNILGDLFSYFVIFFDHPFEIGDFITIDTFVGTIENIGIKTTHIRSLSGEEIIFSNTDLVNSRLRNYKRMRKRRVLFKFGVIYQTSLEQLKEIPVIITEIIQQISGVSLDRVHFAAFGDSSLDFEVVYYVNSKDYNRYMDIQQEINFKMKEEFEKRGIEFAYPTQTLFLEKEETVDKTVK